MPPPAFFARTSPVVKTPKVASVVTIDTLAVVVVAAASMPRMMGLAASAHAQLNSDRFCNTR